ncbi:MAG: sugar transferase [Chloroflexota bacterium]|nr:sugar transferase [Chloroflexota bacterium]
MVVAPSVRSITELRTQIIPRNDWRRGHIAVLVAMDATLIILAEVIAYLGRFDTGVTDYIFIRYGMISAGLLVIWLLAMAASGAYESRHFGTGPGEYKRVVAGTAWAFGLVAISTYIFAFEIARGFITASFVVGLILLLTGRNFARHWLVRQRAMGQLSNRALIVGSAEAVNEMVNAMLRHPGAGLQAVAACTTTEERASDLRHVVRLGGLGDVAEAARRAEVDTVVVTSSPHINPRTLRSIAWGLEGLGIDLVVAPSLSGVALPRLSLRPIGGLTLLHVDEPEFTGAKRWVKEIIDRIGAGLGLILLAPVFLVVALLIRMSDRGPAFYSQYRIGKNGQRFRVHKFRTMYTDADARLAELRAANDSDGLLFKLKDDPRITRVGAILRRTSIDELPQLVNVLFGDMSLVGPRPLPVLDSDFEGHIRRRLLVKPGITGLWQVGGRSDVSWEEAVRLDLDYVENWSLSLDLTIMARTVLTVVRGGGAY